MLKQFDPMAKEKRGSASVAGQTSNAQRSSFSFRNWARPLCLTFALAMLSACSDLQIPNLVSRQDVQLTPVQTCAIGYDLAAQIYKRVVLSKTIIIPGSRPTGCEAHTLTYLKRAGFKIDETAPGPAMTIDLSAGEAGHVAAIATITMTGVAMTGVILGGAGSLRIARTYRLAETGVYPQGAVSFITLPDGAKPRRTRAVSSSAQREDR